MYIVITLYAGPTFRMLQQSSSFHRVIIIYFNSPRSVLTIHTFYISPPVERQDPVLEIQTYRVRGENRHQMGEEVVGKVQ